MFYAWETALAFQKGERPVVRAKSEPAIIEKMQARYKKFFTAFRIDGMWVDLTTYGQGLPPEGRGVSDDRTARYLRGRKRALAEIGAEEVDANTPLIYNEDAGQNEPESEPVVPRAAPSQDFFSANQSPEVEQPAAPVVSEEGVTEQASVERVLLTVDPVVSKGLLDFMALTKEQRDSAIHALAALSLSSETFIRAIELALRDDIELIVEIGSAQEEQAGEG